MLVPLACSAAELKSGDGKAENVYETKEAAFEAAVAAASLALRCGRDTRSGLPLQGAGWQK
jgi:hypothetical protein